MCARASLERARERIYSAKGKYGSSRPIPVSAVPAVVLPRSCREVARVGRFLTFFLDSVERNGMFRPLKSS